MISALLMCHMKKLGHEVEVISVITGSILNYVGLWFVDDGYIPTFATFPLEDAISAAKRH